MNNAVQYTDMKDSGITWLGKVPSHWSIEKAKTHFEQTNSRGNTTPILLSATQKYGMYPQDMLEGVVKVKEDTDLQTFKTVHKGDFVISLRSFQGGFERSDYEGVCSPAYQTFHAYEEISEDYFKFFFKSAGFIDAMNALTVGIREGKNIKFDDFANALIIFPPIDEQSVIASYLDIQCAKIDAIVEEAKASIEEYKSWKASIISEVTTGGLCQGTPCKNSGIEWIGDTPAHWRIRRLYQLVGQVKNKNTDTTETNLLSLSYGKIKRKDINTSDGLLPASFEGYNIIEAGDIVLRLTDLQNDHTSLRVGLSNERGIITSAYTTIRPFNLEHSNYLYYLLHTFDLRKGFYGMGSGVRQGLNYDEVKELRLVLPPETEQADICAYLNEKCDAIDSLISEKESLIEDLMQYKKSLIYEVTTGKRKVV